jgi:hypothetical protein
MPALKHKLFEPMPAMLARQRAWLVGVSIACVVIALVLLAVTALPNLPRPRVWKLATTVIALFPAVVLQPLWHWRKGWLRDLARKNRGRLCTHCAYNVSTLEPAGTCPECGESYDHAADAPLWLAFALRTSVGHRVSGPE